MIARYSISIIQMNNSSNLVVADVDDVYLNFDVSPVPIIGIGDGSAVGGSAVGGSAVDALQRFKHLPSCILEKIYKEYLEPDILCEEYNHIICLTHSQQLCITMLRRHVVKFLSNPLVCNYLSKKCSGWNYSYKIHKTENGKSFVRLNKGDSFCLSILMCLYH